MDFIWRLFFGDTAEKIDQADPVAETAVSDKPDKNKPPIYELQCSKRIKRFFRFHWKGCLVIASPIVLSPLLYEKTLVKSVVFVFILSVIYWVSECLPVMVTSMLPIVFFPLLGILASDVTCRSYFQDTNLVMMGGMIIGLSVEYSNLHRRLAFLFIKVFRGYPRLLHMAVMFITFILSSIISNTAATAIMCPIVGAVLNLLYEMGIVNIYEPKKKHNSHENRRPSKFAIAFYLGTAYAATIGGIGSLIGTGTNITFKYRWEQHYRNHEGGVYISYEYFFKYCFPIGLLMICSTYLYLQVYLMGLFRPNSVLYRNIQDSTNLAMKRQKVFKERYRKQPKISCHEISILVLIFILLILYWTRAPPRALYGWSELIGRE